MNSPGPTYFKYIRPFHLLPPPLSVSLSAVLYICLSNIAIINASCTLPSSAIAYISSTCPQKAQSDVLIFLPFYFSSSFSSLLNFKL